MIKNVIIILFFITWLLIPFSLHAEQYPTKPSNNIVHIKLTNASGIGNRIKNIISHIRYFQPKHINLYWDDKGWVSAKFFDLFSPKWNTTITEYNSQHQIYNIFNYNEPLYPYINTYALLVAEDDFKNKKHQFIDGQYNNIPPEIIDIYTPYFRALEPSMQVKQRINQLNIPKNYVSVFFRNSDDWEKFFNANEPVESFFKIIDTFPSNTIFYLSTLSKETALPFYKRYPNRIIELPNKNYTSMIDTVADMYILGNSHTGIYSIGSTFSEVAWWLGGAKQKVIIVGSNKHWIKQIKVEKLKILSQIPHKKN